LTQEAVVSRDESELGQQYDPGLRSADPFEPHPLGVAIARASDLAVEKAAHPVSHFVRSLAGGAMVAFGVLLSVSVSTGIQTPGLATLLMGLAFGFSFVLILVSSMSLVTADMAAGVVAMFRRRMTLPQYLRFLVSGFIGNGAGVLVFVGIAALAGGPYISSPFFSHAYSVGIAKSGTSDYSTFLLAILCTWFLQTSMFLYYTARTDMARMSFAFYGPFAFVIGLTEHVIANIGFISFPLLLHYAHPGAALSGGSGGLSWGLGSHGLLRNLIWAALGNLVGGTVFVAIPFWLIATWQNRAAAVPRPGESGKELP
jgi:formate/nitrite transporter FocA (FNT family)